MSTIVTRAGKGSALTWTEGDANITNLNNDKLEDITNESIGDLSDVDLTSIADGNTLVWNNANSKFQVGNAGASAISDLGDVTITTPSSGQVLTYMPGGQWENQDLAASGIASLSEDTSPSLSGDLTFNGYSILTNSSLNVVADGNIILNPTGQVYIGPNVWNSTDGTTGQVLTTDGAGNLYWSNPSSGASSTLTADLDVSTFKITSTSQNYIQIGGYQYPNSELGGGAAATGSISSVNAGMDTLSFDPASTFAMGDAVTFNGTNVVSAGLMIGQTYYIGMSYGAGVYSISSTMGGTPSIDINDPGAITDFQYSVTASGGAGGSTPMAGDVLSYNGAGALGFITPSNPSSNLNSLTDVNAMTAAEGDTLVYTGGMWQNQAPAGGGGGFNGYLSLVSINTGSPTSANGLTNLRPLTLTPAVSDENSAYEAISLTNGNLSWRFLNTGLYKVVNAANDGWDQEPGVVYVKNYDNPGQIMTTYGNYNESGTTAEGPRWFYTVINVTNTSTNYCITTNTSNSFVDPFYFEVIRVA